MRHSYSSDDEIRSCAVKRNTVNRNCDAQERQLGNSNSANGQFQHQNVRVIVPGFLGNDMRTLVLIWRYGNEQSDCIPVRELQDASSRRKYLKGMHSQVWIRSHKNKFQKLQRLMRIVASAPGSNIQDIFVCGSDEEWEAALHSLENVYGEESLTKVVTKK